MEAEIRLILTAAATEEERPRTDLFSALTERFAQLGGVDLDVPARTTPPRAADFGE
jgi:plasmid stability protein